MRNHLAFYYKCICLLICLHLWHFVSAAEDELEILSIDKLKKLSLLELMQVTAIPEVSIATGKKQSAARAPAIVSVITAEDIEKTTATDIDDILESVPGLHVARSAVSYYNPIYSLGGVYSIYNPETLVLLDGIPINTLYTGGRILMGYGGMSTTAVERIEVIRGPASAIVYGADALAGVINVITKKGSDINGTETGVRIGSFEQRDAWLRHGGEYAGVNVGLTLDYHDTRGQQELIAEDAQTQYDKLFNTHVSLAPGGVNLSQRNWDINLNLEKNHWKFHTLYQQHGNVGMGVGGAQALGSGVQNDVESNRIYTDLTYHNDKFTKNWDVTARASYADMGYAVGNTVMYPPGAFGGAFPDGMRVAVEVEERHAYFDISGIYKGIEHHELRLGMGYRYGNLYKVIDKINFGMNPKTGQAIPPTVELTDVSDTSATFLPTGKRKNWQLFAQDIWEINERWELTTGMRYDSSSDFGSALNPRVGLVWQTTPSLTTKFLYGKAFRAPSFQELYQANNPVALGNPNVKPEHIQTLEAAVDYRPNQKWHIGANIFTYRLTDKILFVQDKKEQVYLAQNAGSQTGKGFVVEGGWLFNENWAFAGSYAYQRAEDQEQHTIANVPLQDIYLRADWRISPSWCLSSQASWILDRHRTANDPREPVKDFVNVDLSLHYAKPKSPWHLTLTIRNLFDADVREPTPGPDESGMIKIPYDLPMPGFNYFLEFRYNF
jgi:outer membrane receptor protein involved in Fe transport